MGVSGSLPHRTRRVSGSLPALDQGKMLSALCHPRHDVVCPILFSLSGVFRAQEQYRHHVEMQQRYALQVPLPTQPHPARFLFRTSPIPRPTPSLAARPTHLSTEASFCLQVLE